MGNPFEEEGQPISETESAKRKARRDFLVGAASHAANGAILAAMVWLSGNESNQEYSQTETVHRGENARTYRTGRLNGRRAGGLFASYLGLPTGSRISENVTVDFSDVLDALWERKYQQATDADVRANIRRTGERLKHEYREDLKNGRHESVGLSVFAAESERIVTRLKQKIEWSRLNTIPQFSGLTELDVRLVRAIAEKITGKMMFAYAVTELMPSLNHSDMNVDMTEFLLKNAGKKFLSRVPAVHDDMLSFGMFQFTSLALYDVPGERRGASVINGLISEREEGISGSVATNEEADEQIRAAYLFAVQNTAHLLSEIRQSDTHAAAERRIATLRRHLPNMGSSGKNENYGLMQYLASAHHFPAPARTGFIRWIDHDFQGSHAERCRGRIVDYIKKSQGNYREILRRLGQ